MGTGHYASRCIGAPHAYFDDCLGHGAWAFAAGHRSGDPGREIEGPMAIVIVGGLATSTLLNLLVLPALALRYGRFEKTSGSY